MTRWAVSLRFAGSLLAVCAACGSGSGSGGGAGIDGGAGSGGSLAFGGGSAGNAGTSGSGGPAGFGGSAGAEDAGAPPSACEAYIACVAETTPAGLAAVLAAYGKTGSCWQQGDLALCEQACHSGIVAAHKAFPEAQACNRCDTSADCPSTAPACDTTAHRCVECVSSADCGGGSEPACDTVTQTCVACMGNGDCPNPNQPACDTTTHSCVQCTNNSQCDPFMGPVCDPATHKCRQCAMDSECTAGVCAGGVCTECKNDAQCSGAKPHCGSMGFCIACVNDSECAPGVCSFGSCCGVNACANNGVKCGSTVDLGCIFQPISCGVCSAQNLCVNGDCKPKPTNTCVAASCASKKCGYFPEKNAYDCIAGASYCTDTKACDAGYKCAKTTVNGSNYYTCQNYCVTNADCTNTKTCQPSNGPNSYGVCK